MINDRCFLIIDQGLMINDHLYVMIYDERSQVPEFTYGALNIDDSMAIR